MFCTKEEISTLLHHTTPHYADNVIYKWLEKKGHGEQG